MTRKTDTFHKEESIVTDDKKDLGIGQPVDPEWLAIEENIRRDVEWALDAGKGKFIVACWAVMPAGECDPKTLPPDVVLPRDKDTMQVVKRVNAFFPFSDMPLALRQFKDSLSILLRHKHKQELTDLDAAGPPEMGEGPPALALAAPPEEVDAESKEEGPSALRCPSCNNDLAGIVAKHNADDTFQCAYCRNWLILLCTSGIAPDGAGFRDWLELAKGESVDDNGQPVPAEPEALGS